MKKNLFIGIGALIFLSGILSNLQWAANNYGYKTISLQPQILAQDTGSGTGSGSVKYEDQPIFKLVHRDCILDIEGKAGGTAMFGPIEIQLDANGSARITLQGAEIGCDLGGIQKCRPRSCLAAVEGIGTFAE